MLTRETYWMISHKFIRIYLSPGCKPQKRVIVIAAGIFAMRNVCITTQQLLLWKGRFFLENP